MAPNYVTTTAASSNSNGVAVASPPSATSSTFYHATYDFELQLYVQSFCDDIVHDVLAGRLQTSMDDNCSHKPLQATMSAVHPSHDHNSHTNVAASSDESDSDSDYADGEGDETAESGPVGDEEASHSLHPLNVDTSAPPSGRWHDLSATREGGARFGDGPQGDSGGWETEVADTIAQMLDDWASNGLLGLVGQEAAFSLVASGVAICSDGGRYHQNPSDSTAAHSHKAQTTNRSQSYIMDADRRLQLLQRWSHVPGPFFTDVRDAKAFLQLSFNVSVREEAARHALLRSVQRWWKDLRRLAAPLHAAASSQHHDGLRLQHREAAARVELDQEESIGRTVIRFMLSALLNGSDLTKRVFLMCGDLAEEERHQRTAMISQELHIRAQLTAAHRTLALIRGNASQIQRQVAAQLLAVAMQAAYPATYRYSPAASGPTVKTSITTTSGGSARRRSTARSFADTIATADHAPEMRTFDPTVSIHVKSLERSRMLREARAARADVIRGVSQALAQRIAATKAHHTLSRRRDAEAMRVASRLRREELFVASEARFAKLREESRIETLACERQSYEIRHPEHAETFLSLLVGSRQHRDAIAAVESGVHQPHTVDPALGLEISRISAGGANSSIAASSVWNHNHHQTQQSPVVDTSSVSHDRHHHAHHGDVSSIRRPLSTSTRPHTSTSHVSDLWASVPCIPKHQLQPEDRRALRRVREAVATASILRQGSASSVLQRKKSEDAAARVFRGTTGAAATQWHRKDDSINPKQFASTEPATSSASNLTVSSGATKPRVVRRSRTPPLEDMERLLVESCSALRDAMLQTPYQYVAPLPILYASDGTDSTAGRNILADDMELHGLTPLERMLRWNVRAQQAMRLGQLVVAEGHLTNAMTALVNAEKMRRRASRRRNSTEGSNGSEDPPRTADEGGAGRSAADSLLSGFGQLSLQNIKILTYTTRSFLLRHQRRFRDALQDLQTVLSVQEAQAVELQRYRAAQQHADQLSRPDTGGVGRRATGVRVVSPRSDEDNAVAQHMLQNNAFGVLPDTLLNISALLLQLNSVSESLLYARRAVTMLTDQCESEMKELKRGGDGGGSPQRLLKHRNVFQQAVAALHNVAMAQGAQETTTNGSHSDARQVAKATLAAAMRLAHEQLGADHALTVKVEAAASVTAQMLSQ